MNGLGAFDIFTDKDYTAMKDHLDKIYNQNEGKYSQKLEEAAKIAAEVNGVAKRILLVDASTQTIHLYEEGKRLFSYLCSTAKNGLGNEEGSYKTPTGLHLIKEKIGDNSSPKTVFISRKPDEEQFILNQPAVRDGKEVSQIVSRILWLEGLQEGINKGQNENGKVVDTHERYIYIHGTNRIDQTGTAESAGCVRMTPNDVAHLYQEVEKGTLVYIFA